METDKIPEKSQENTKNSPENSVKIPKLPPRREKFCQEYIKDFNGAQAAIRAGYSNKCAKETAAEILTNPNVKTRISQLEIPVLEKVLVDAEWVLRRSIEIVERCMQHSPVIVRVDGEQIQATDPETGEGVYCFDAKGANQALALIAKHTGGFIERQDHTTKGEKIKTENLFQFTIIDELKNGDTDKQEASPVPKK